MAVTFDRAEKLSECRCFGSGFATRDHPLYHATFLKPLDYDNCEVPLRDCSSDVIRSWAACRPKPTVRPDFSQHVRVASCASSSGILMVALCFCYSWSQWCRLTALETRMDLSATVLRTGKCLETFSLLPVYVIVKLPAASLSKITWLRTSACANHCQIRLWQKPNLELSTPLYDKNASAR